MATTTADTAAIHRDIESTRADLGAAMFALGDRVAPKKVVARFKANVRAKVAARVDEVKLRLSPPRLARRAMAALHVGGGSDDRRRALPSGRPMRQLPSGSR